MSWNEHNGSGKHSRIGWFKHFLACCYPVARDWGWYTHNKTMEKQNTSSLFFYIDVGLSNKPFVAEVSWKLLNNSHDYL